MGFSRRKKKKRKNGGIARARNGLLAVLVKIRGRIRDIWRAFDFVENRLKKKYSPKSLNFKIKKKHLLFGNIADMDGWRRYNKKEEKNKR